MSGQQLSVAVGDLEPKRTVWKVGGRYCVHLDPECHEIQQAKNQPWPKEAGLLFGDEPVCRTCLKRE